jgi:hypothetical protein
MKKMSRTNYIIQMYDFGKRGISDFGKTAKKIIPPSKKLLKRTTIGPVLKNLDPKIDVRGYDMPRDDIKIIRLKNKKIIRIGSNTINRNLKYFKKYILPYINRSFTKSELQNLNLYIEYPDTKLDKKFGGMSIGYKSDKNINYSTISISDKKDASTAVHEILHAVRHYKRNASKNIHRDEAETELETLARLPKKYRKNIPCGEGYYTLIGNKKNRCKARADDMKFIDKKCGHKKNLTSCIRKNLKKTNIGKLKIPKKYKPDQ